MTDNLDFKVGEILGTVTEIKQTLRDHVEETRGEFEKINARLEPLEEFKQAFKTVLFIISGVVALVTAFGTQVLANITKLFTGH